jgi:hypothetical protein
MEEIYKPKTCKVCGETLVSSICHMCDGEGTIDDTATDPLEGDEFSLCPECHGAGLYLDCPNAPHEATALDKVISICDVDGLLLKADTELRRKVCQDARVEIASLRARITALEQAIDGRAKVSEYQGSIIHALEGTVNEAREHFQKIVSYAQAEEAIGECLPMASYVSRRANAWLAAHPAPAPTIHLVDSEIRVDTC